VKRDDERTALPPGASPEERERVYAELFMTLPPLTLVKRELLGSVHVPAAQTKLPSQV
jgi:hypothetical protein